MRVGSGLLSQANSQDRRRWPHGQKRNLQIQQRYEHWRIAKCGWCGKPSHWATDGRNLFCALCGH